MDWGKFQLICPLLAIIPWPAGFIFFGDIDRSQADQIETFSPFVFATVNFDDRKAVHVPVLTISDELTSPYIKMAVGTIYDGEKWRLKDIADDNEFDRLDLSGDSSVAVQNNLYPVYSDIDKTILKKAEAANDIVHLGLPDNTSNRLENLARQITEGLQTPFEKAETIKAFLQTRYVYNLDFIPAPAGWEPNDWFIFEGQEGVCTNFNSAFVLLARSAGIPARLVVGYYVETGLDRQTIYSDQAHAWAEINLEELGWITFDSKPSSYLDGL